MSVVQLQQNTLLPLLRVACQTQTVQGLDLLHIKAAGSATLQYYDVPIVGQITSGSGKCSVLTT